MFVHTGYKPFLCFVEEKHPWHENTEMYLIILWLLNTTLTGLSVFFYFSLSLSPSSFPFTLPVITYNLVSIIHKLSPTAEKG